MRPLSVLAVLEGASPGWRTKPPPPPEIMDSDEHYVVQQSLNNWLIQGWLHFLIKWEGYGYENTWVPEGNVSAPGKIWEFYQNHPRAPQWIQSSALQSIHFQNPSTLRTHYSKRGMMSGDNCLFHWSLLDHWSSSWFELWHCWILGSWPQSSGKFMAKDRRIIC